MPNPGPKHERPDHTKKGHHEGGYAGFAHAVDIRLDASDEHEHQAPDLRQKHECAGGLPAIEQVDMQQVQCAGAEHHTNQ